MGLANSTRCRAVWHYDKHGKQRKIPDLAIKNLTRPELWYEDR